MPLDIAPVRDSHGNMSSAGFLTPEELTLLTALAKSGKLEHRVARRANAMVLLDRGFSFTTVAEVLLVDDSTVRDWQAEFRSTGIEGLQTFHHKGSEPRLSTVQETALASWVSAMLPRSSGEVAQWIDDELDIHFSSRSGIINLLHRLGFEHRKPEAVPAKADVAKQTEFIDRYEKQQNSLEADEATVFVDAVHPTHGTRAVGCWMPKGEKIGVDQSSGRDRLNIHGVIDLETGKTRMIDVLTVDAMSTIALLTAVENMHPDKRRINVHLDNARYHHAKAVREWMAEPGRRVVLHFIPSYCPHLNPIERLWGLMHKAITHNRCYQSFRQFADAILGFLRKTVPEKWSELCDHVSDNFRVVDPAEVRILN